MARLSEDIHTWLGWCPQGTAAENPDLHESGSGFPDAGASPTGPITPAPAATAPAEYRPKYQTNLVLILLLLGGLIYATRLDLILPFNILSAVLIYFDAENIHAGEKFEKVSLLGEVATWRPIVWAAAMFIGSFFLLAIYLVCRREIYNANN